MFLLIDQLSESQLFPSRKSLGKYEPQEISELAYLHIIALNILLSEEYSHVWATNYAKKTTRSTNFKKWRNDATDLYVMMHALADDSENLGDDNNADYYRDGIGIYPTMIFNWISRAGMNNEKEADTKRLFSKMDQMFRIRNGSMRAIRRLVQDWDDLSLHDKKLAMTRLLQFMRARCPKSDLLAQLTKLSASNKLELHGVNNPEALEGPRKPKGSFLLSLGAGVAGGLIGAALVRKMREGTTYKIPTKTFGKFKLQKISVDNGPFTSECFVIKKGSKEIFRSENQFYAEAVIRGLFNGLFTVKNIPKSFNDKRSVGWENDVDWVYESASGGGTGASSVAAVPGNGASAAGTIGAGFDLDYSKSVYPSPAPKKEKKKAVLSRLTEDASIFNQYVTIDQDLVYEVASDMSLLNFDVFEDDDGEPDYSYIESRIRGALDELSVGVVNHRLTLYRAIDIKNMKDLRNDLGIYWSSTKSGAHPYNGNQGNNAWLLLTASVDLKDVDWRATLALHIGGGEDEIRLDKGIPLRIENAEWMSHNNSHSKLQVLALIGKSFTT